MQAIVSLTRGLSRTLVNGVVSRNQSNAESTRAKHEEEADSRLGKFLVTVALINNTDNAVKLSFLTSIKPVFIRYIHLTILNFYTIHHDYNLKYNATVKDDCKM